jgi:hypothetical protein
MRNEHPGRLDPEVPRGLLPGGIALFFVALWVLAAALGERHLSAALLALGVLLFGAALGLIFVAWGQRSRRPDGRPRNLGRTLFLFGTCAIVLLGSAYLRACATFELHF